jgi:hypothetical protein
MSTTVCSDCNESKPKTTEFFFTAKRQLKDRLAIYFFAYCRPCAYKRKVKYEATDRASFGVGWAKDILSKARHNAKTRGHIPPNITPEELSLKRQAYAGLCECCGTPDEHPHHDHDHITGFVRGFICYLCNSKAIPTVERNLHTKAVKYLDKYVVQ